jgi:hypothetical protein
MPGAIVARISAGSSTRPSGWFATFADPDGNYLQIIQFHPKA